MRSAEQREEPRFGALGLPRGKPWGCALMKRVVVPENLGHAWAGLIAPRGVRLDPLATLPLVSGERSRRKWAD